MLSYIITFIVGAFVGRYFEAIRDLVLKVGNDLSDLKNHR